MKGKTTFPALADRTHPITNGIQPGNDVAVPTARHDVAVAAAGLRQSFGHGESAVSALGPLDLEVSRGDFVCVVGPSGCGKSTLIRIVAGLIQPTSGTVRLRLGRSDTTPIATVFQDFGIFPWKTVEANVRFGLTVQGVGRKEATARARDWLARLGLGEFADSYPAALSGGMRQRVAIARALAVEPEVLLMDEPFASLDVQLREILQGELLAMSQSEQRTVIFVTHSLDEALILGDRVLVMTARPGRVLGDHVVPFERPRSTAIRNAPEFGDLRAGLWEELRAEVNAQLGSLPGGPR